MTAVRTAAARVANPALLVALLIPWSVEAQIRGRAPELVAHRVTLVRDWARSVARHIPGEVDAALILTSTWTGEELRDLWIGANVLNVLMNNPRMSEFSVLVSGVRMPLRIARPDLDAIRNIAEDLNRRPGADVFRKKAAIFHMDAAMLLVGDSTASPVYSSFLMPRRVIVRTGDGQQEGVYGGDVNWEFARQLLDSVQDVGEDMDVRLWYQATLAYKLTHEFLDTPHFSQALRLFPRDPTILLLNGALQENFADARVQAVIKDVDVPFGTRLDAQSEETHLHRAEALYRQVLQIEPEHVEARIRLGRVLGRQSRHRDAAAELRTAVRHKQEAFVAYYAHLFLGAEEELLGRIAEAREAYQRAATLYPEAQAPRLALSQLMHRTGDRVAAREALAGMLQRDRQEITDDPLWMYRVSAGRLAEEMVAAVRRSMVAGTTQ